MRSGCTETLLLALLMATASCISFPVFGYRAPSCMVLVTYYEPLKVQLKFPVIPDKKPGEKFDIAVYSYLDEEIEEQDSVDDNTTFRKNYNLENNQLYHLCVSLQASRELPKPIYVSYSATENFEQLIGKIEIPPQLSKEENLKAIYQSAKKLGSLNKIISSHQAKERSLEEGLAVQNLQKNQRIIVLTLIQILVIVLSGVYQVFALRKFLIEKNLY